MKVADRPTGADSTLARCREHLPHDLLCADEPVFSEPWQAQAFALAVHLIDEGLITWPEWSAALGKEIADAGNNDIREDGSEYYLLWLRTLEGLVAEKALASPGELHDLTNDWREAYRDTPHGQSVELPSD